MIGTSRVVWSNAYVRELEGRAAKMDAVVNRLSRLHEVVAAADDLVVCIDTISIDQPHDHWPQLERLRAAIANAKGANHD